MEGARRADAIDRPRCAALLEEALGLAHTMRGGTTLAGAASAPNLLDAWLAAGSDTAVFVGLIDDAVVGLLAVTTFSRPDRTGASGRIECCYVEEGARGVGVGTALLEAAVAWCRDHGCADIDSPALPGDRLTKQRLEAAGFTARLLTLNRRLD